MLIWASSSRWRASFTRCFSSDTLEVFLASSFSSSFILFSNILRNKHSVDVCTPGGLRMRGGHGVTVSEATSTVSLDQMSDPFIPLNESSSVPADYLCDHNLRT